MDDLGLRPGAGQLRSLLVELGGEQVGLLEQLPGVGSRIVSADDAVETTLEAAQAAVFPPTGPAPGVAEAGVSLSDGEAKRVPVAVDVDGEEVLSRPRCLPLDPNPA